MVAKIPIRTVYTGAAATGLAEFQAGEFLDYPVGGTGQTTLGTANQILATNAGATAIVWADPTTGDITGVTAGTGLSGGGTDGTVALAIDTSVTADLSTSQSLSNKAITTSTFSGTQVDITAQGDLRLQDTTGGQYVALQAPGTVSTSWTATLPGAVGTSGQALRTSDGSGTLEWFTPETGDISGVTAGDGLTGGGTTGTVTLDVVGGTGITATANDIAIDSSVVTLDGSQTLTNKTLTSPTISGGTVSVTQVDVTAQGDLRLQDTTGGQYVALQAPGVVGTSWTATFPAAVGSSGQALRTSNGSGTLEWFTPEVGDITGVTAGDGLTGGGTSGTVTLDVVGGTGITANANDIAIDATVATLSGSQTFTNKGIDLGTNTLTGTVAQFNTALQSASFATLAGSETLSNKTIDSAANTLTLDMSEGTLVGTVAEFNTALTGESFTTRGGAETLTNKTLTSPVLNGTLSGTAFLDEDNMSSNSAVATASQQSIKAYVDAVSSGLDLKESSHVATTANLSSAYDNGASGVGATLTNNSTQAALTVDGQLMVAGERLLVKDQTAGLQNGIYTVTTVGTGSSNWVLTRATDFDGSPSNEVDSGAFTFVETGTVNADSGWVVTTDGTITIGTTAISFSQFSGAGQITAGDGMTKSGNTLNVVGTSNKITVSANAVTISSTYVGQTSLTTLGTIGTGTWQGTAIANAYIGTTIDATKLADGTVTNAELQYINSLSSNAQTQITNVKTTADAASTKGFAIAMGVALG